MQVAQEGTYHHAHCFATVGGAIERMSLDITDDISGVSAANPSTPAGQTSRRNRCDSSLWLLTVEAAPSLIRQICREYIDNLLVLCALNREGGWY